MGNVRILAFDPGEKYTGWAVVTGDKRIRTGELSSWAPLEALFDQANPTVVVCEDYRLYPQKAAAQFGSQLKAVRTIGVIQWLAMQRHILFVEQTASRIRKDPLVKDVKVSRSNHANDAAKHALVYWHKLKGSYDKPRRR